MTRDHANIAAVNDLCCQVSGEEKVAADGQCKGDGGGAAGGVFVMLMVAATS